MSFTLHCFKTAIIYPALPNRSDHQCAEGDFVLPWGNIQAYQAIIHLINCKCLHLLMILIAVHVLNRFFFFFTRSKSSRELFVDSSFLLFFLISFMLLDMQGIVDENLIFTCTISIKRSVVWLTVVFLNQAIMSDVCDFIPVDKQPQLEIVI